MNMNDLIELSKKLNTHSISQQRIDISGEVSYHGIVKTYRKYKIRIDLYKTFLAITINVNSNLALAVNNPDLMHSYDVAFPLNSSPYPIYVSDNPGSFVKDDNVKKFLNDILLFLEVLSLSDRESAYFYNNKIRLILLPKRDAISVLDNLIDLISKNWEVFNIKSDQAILKKNIPKNLTILFPFLKKYAVADDSERAQLVGTINEKKRRELIDVVNPLFKEIDEYLNSFEDRPLTNEAILVGNLAELVRELINRKPN